MKLSKYFEHVPVFIVSQSESLNFRGNSNLINSTKTFRDVLYHNNEHHRPHTEIGMIKNSERERRHVHILPGCIAGITGDPILYKEVVCNWPPSWLTIFKAHAQQNKHQTLKRF